MPFSVGVIVDLSGSMRQKLPAATAAVRALAFLTAPAAITSLIAVGCLDYFFVPPAVSSRGAGTQPWEDLELIDGAILPGKGSGYSCFTARWQ